MKNVLISIKPKWCELIASGKKTVEVRKTRPKIELPFKCYIYQTLKPVLVSLSGTGRHISEYDKTYYFNERSGKIIGEFVCDEIEDYKLWQYEIDALHRHIKLNACIDYPEIRKYLGSEKQGYGWHISNLVIYDKPKELRDFIKYGFVNPVPLERPPQSWMYVEDMALGTK